MGLVVDENSGVLGLPHERRRPMPVDHHGVCRFASFTDDNYRKVLSAMREMATLIFPSHDSVESEHYTQ